MIKLFAALLILRLESAYCDTESSTQWPSPSIESASSPKQTVEFPVLKTPNGVGSPESGSSGLPDPTFTPSRKKPKARLDPVSKISKNQSQDPSRSHPSLPLYGKMVHAPTSGPKSHTVAPFRPQPDAPNVRRPGFLGSNRKLPPIHLPAPGPGSSNGESFIDRRGGERQETYGFDRYHVSRSNKDSHSFVPQPQVYEGEDELIKDTHEGATECQAKCEELEFFCVQSCSCLHKDLRCDGNTDCMPYGEDEKDCEELNEIIMKNIRTDCEKSGERVLCPTTYACISKEWLCDGDDDCGDFSDETRCGGHKNCSSDQFECSNGLCIPKEWVCDGDNDCKDYSDEFNCTRKCLSNEFECGDGSCISDSFHCDGETDCSDGTDELSCENRLSSCPEGEFKCRGSLGGIGGPGGRCVLMRYRCDGDNDCGDWSDEENCPRKQSSCTQNEFKCDDGTCISMRWRCDQEQDCDSGEDEKGCPNLDKDVRHCSPDEFKCQDNKCILKSWLCDGIPDCKRGEDEINCQIKCEIGQFPCPPAKANATSQRICVNQKHICDGHNDCPTGADEENCPIEHPCGAHSQCEQLCTTNYQGKEECACKVGFVLHSNGVNCVDINECEFTMNPVCSQNCTNTYGLFRCSCFEGYVLRPDLRTCKAMGGAVNLIMANRADIRQVSLSNNKFVSIIKGLPNAISVDFHYKKNLLFWSDVSTDVIKKAFINGTMVRDVIKWGLESPGGIAVDWIHDLVFWTDSGTRRVEVSNFDGTLRAVVAANDLDKPRAVVVHPGHALVIWTDWGPNAKIERAYMDGQDRQTITSEGIFWPNGLAIDYVTDRLFWADAKHHVIESSNLDGSERKKIMSSNLPHPFALTIFEDSLFWTDWHTKSISTANKITGKGFRHIHDELHFPMDLHSFHPSRQPSFANKCKEAKGGISRTKSNSCSHLCLPTRNGRRCACPIGLTLMEDKKTCTSEPDKLLLVARKKDIRIRQLNTREPEKEIDMVIPLDGLKNIIALDWCSETNVIYWGDVGRNAIAKAFLNGSNQETVIASNLQQPAGLALDWVTNKLYWTDSGTNRIEVATTDGKYRSLLVWQGLEKPRDIVVSPVDGLMFWTDWGSTPLIERAGMDGSGRKAIVKENIAWPNGLAVDRDNGRLYFVDAGTKTLEYVNYDGLGRDRLIANGLIHPFGLDVYGGKIYWTDWETQSVQFIDEISTNSKYSAAKNRKTIISNLTDLMDVRIFHRNRKDIRNPCASHNGDCSHMCLLNPSGYSCACPIGVLLSGDQHTCENGPKNYILLAHRVDIRQISLDIDHLIDVVLQLPPLSHAVTLDVDTRTGDIYWADTEEDTISRSSPDGKNVRQILSESMDSVDGLVVDSVGRKIYWTDGGRHTVEVSELDGANRNVLHWQNVDSPRGIALDYEFGYLFWTDWGAHPRIERSFMDGDNRTVLVTTEVVWPNGLAADSLKKRIYWTDAKLNHIMSSDFDGNMRVVVARKLEHPYGVAVSSSGVVYFTDWKTNSLRSVQPITDDNDEIKTISKDLEGLMDVKVVETGRSKFTNACRNNNGGCSHLCLRRPSSYSCRCPTGIRMKEGSRTECESLPTAFLLIGLRSGIGRISLDTNELFDVVLPIEGVHGAVVLDFHHKHSQLFYADVNIDCIRRINMYNLSDSRTIISTGLRIPNGLAVDWVADNIYWSDSFMKVIEVARLDGSSRKKLISTGLDDPRAMILYPRRAFLFWADWGAQPRIERALMNGQERKVIINSDVGFPTGLSVDFEARQLYWADALQDRIERCDFDGKNRHQVIPLATHPFGLTMHGSSIYWTDWYNKSVLHSIRSNGGFSQVEEVRHGLRGAMDIRAVARERQPFDDNPCANQNGDCTHLCLIGRNSYSCECPDKPDDRTCKKKVIPYAIDDESDSLVPDKWPPKSNPKQNKDDGSKSARAFVTATIVLGGILIIVVIAIVGLMCSPKRRRNKETSTDLNRSMLTFANPNYNGADPLSQPGHSRQQGGAKNSGIWRKLKYDKGQDRVYEVKCLGIPDTATTTLMSGSPSPSSSAILPLSTIG